MPAAGHSIRPSVLYQIPRIVTDPPSSAGACSAGLARRTCGGRHSAPRPASCRRHASGVTPAAGSDQWDPVSSRVTNGRFRRLVGMLVAAQAPASLPGASCRRQAFGVTPAGAGRRSLVPAVGMEPRQPTDVPCGLHPGSPEAAKGGVGIDVLRLSGGVPAALPPPAALMARRPSVSRASCRR